MAKKKKTRKKVHRSSSKARPQTQSVPAPISAPVPAAGGAAVAAASSPSIAAPPVAAATVPIGRWAYVGTDLRRVGVLAIACIIIEAIAWFLFNHTGVGTAIYSHINL